MKAHLQAATVALGLFSNLATAIPFELGNERALPLISTHARTCC
jgi:hypothetical protein